MDTGARIRTLREKNKMTQEALAGILGTTKQTIYKYENDIIASIPPEKVEKLAAALGCTPAYLMGWDDAAKGLDNLFPISMKKIPLLGEIACGEPIFAEEEHESYALAGSELKADFCLKCKGDSMTGARIYEGDIVFIHRQDTVENGEIAAVIIDDEATLKRVYYNREKEELVLSAENPKYPPFVFRGEALNHIRILGRAVAFQSDLR